MSNPALSPSYPYLGRVGHNIDSCTVRDLVFFSCECRGVKFYGLSNAGELFGSQVTFTRNPDHHKDPNCVEVMVVKQPENIIVIL